MSLHSSIAELESTLGLTAFVHARAIDDDRTIGVRDDDSVVAASVFKIPVLVEACLRMASGEIAVDKRIDLAPSDFVVDGGTGIAVFSDAVSLSFRDLCLSMMTVSDNRATDAVVDLLSVSAINGRMVELGLPGTVLEGDCRYLFDSIAEDIAAQGVDQSGEVTSNLNDLDEAMLRSRALDVERTNRTTPAETTSLLSALWRDKGLPPAACAEARRILGLQIWPHRLRRGFPSEVTVSGKTGTLPYVRNEVGVVEYDDGSRFAVAVFLRTPNSTPIAPAFDDAIAQIAAAAVGDLRTP